MDDRFETLSPAAIREGTATDAYFLRTETTLEHAGKNPRVVAEVTADQFPTGEFEAFGGIKDVANLLAGRELTVHAIREGRLFDGGPVMRIEGPYLEFARFETSILGFLSQASAFLSAALDVRRAAPDSQVLSFGARHLHPMLAPTVERAALIAGLDGFSHVAAGEVLGREAGGTMPHALLLCYGRGNQQAAFRAFDEAVPEDVPRIALCDTFSDEIEEVLGAIEALGDDLDSVRIDTTGSRRGDFEHILKELRWHLDSRGYEDVGIFASGGLGPADLRELRDVAAGFGVGGAITSADPVDFALDIVEIEGEAIAKRGKLPGVKEVYRTSEGGHHVALADREDADGEALLEPLIEDGEIVREFGIDVAEERLRADAAAVL
ncbi:nicotinate phosphoribosyltransferase [Halalkalicoccus jeotgali]|uniref:Nicotinate phosphoribosyltransferase n=1 Tax=Halalkalicoccus jeotgali (strain DSM 18796 / CECT 7217 / JCM 14584 / KCTC 4019 / B3) TaxID=795797 RepID=D8J974_HALJB|nr:nicotinate phosphoribosyltransferase [Halalkalicoccus jeotgali]ADJ16343.1 nicotinate phosphoribosyltransferase [Halalkalicoccus jeotgali B3]ELY37077.1 nicotinate phosphoribosyltransferase [Halalkalicoccus jeotgali B3]